MKLPSRPELTEMRARRHDPSSIAEYERLAARWEAAQPIARAIEQAFANVKLGRGVGLQEAQGLDDYADAETIAAYRDADEKDDWHRIPKEMLKRCYSSLSFFDAEGMRFHLPAYLLADLRGDYLCGMAFCLTQPHDFNHYFRLLSDAQRNAVRAFLLHILDVPEYHFDRPHIFRALEGYWIEIR